MGEAEEAGDMELVTPRGILEAERLR